MSLIDESISKFSLQHHNQKQKFQNLWFEKHHEQLLQTWRRIKAENMKKERKGGGDLFLLFPLQCGQRK